MKYTQKEIDSSINTLTNRLEMLSLERKGLNEQMRDVKKNIKFYEEIDCSQLKETSKSKNILTFNAIIQ